jgi:hypothetical protein
MHDASTSLLFGEASSLAFFPNFFFITSTHALNHTSTPPSQAFKNTGNKSTAESHGSTRRGGGAVARLAL